MGIRVMKIQEDAERLGFSSIEDALDAGYEVAYTADPENTHLKKCTSKDIVECDNCGLRWTKVMIESNDWHCPACYHLIGD